LPWPGCKEKLVLCNLSRPPTRVFFPFFCSRYFYDALNTTQQKQKKGSNGKAASFSLPFLRISYKNLASFLFVFAVSRQRGVCFIIGECSRVGCQISTRSMTINRKRIKMWVSYHSLYYFFFWGQPCQVF